MTPYVFAQDWYASPHRTSCEDSTSPKQIFQCNGRDISKTCASPHITRGTVLLISRRRHLPWAQLKCAEVQALFTARQIFQTFLPRSANKSQGRARPRCYILQRFRTAGQLAERLRNNSDPLASCDNIIFAIQLSMLVLYRVQVYVLLCIVTSVDSSRKRPLELGIDLPALAMDTKVPPHGAEVLYLHWIFDASTTWIREMEACELLMCEALEHYTGLHALATTIWPSTVDLWVVTA